MRAIKKSTSWLFLLTFCLGISSVGHVSAETDAVKQPESVEKNENQEKKSTTEETTQKLMMQISEEPQIDQRKKALLEELRKLYKANFL